MDQGKLRRLAAAGFRTGSAAEFLGLTDAESALVEMKLALSRHLRDWRTREGLSQAALARRLESSQSRVAKMEAGDPGVSIDLLFRALLTLGATRDGLAEVISSAPRPRERGPTPEPVVPSEAEFEAVGSGRRA